MGIDRKRLVRRHKPLLTTPDPLSPLSIGNGELAFTADITGFQTFEYMVPLCTMAQWGFHDYPHPESRETRYSRLKLTRFHAGDRIVGYMNEALGQEELYTELRVSPHRANLVRVSLVEPDDTTIPRGGGEELRRLQSSQCDHIRQELDLWEGLLRSEYSYRGSDVHAQAVSHPERDALSFRLESPLLRKTALAVELAFPYPSHHIDGSDWNRERDHRSTFEQRSEDLCLIRRHIDKLAFTAAVRLGEGCRIIPVGAHRFVVASSGASLSFTLEFLRGESLTGPPNQAPPDWDECSKAAAHYWEEFWSSGAMIELAGSRDPRAHELERRIVLSRYLTAIQCSGSLPPQETGLTCNSWYGKFHLEMHLWHAAFFPLWGNPQLLKNSLDYYGRIAETARARARNQGYRGLRWPKMTDPEGFDSPSPIGPFLCWQQPHFMFMVELLYRTGEVTVFERYRDLVFESAEFMADYASHDPETDTYELAPPLIPAQENHIPEETLNPVYELEYWKLGLDIAAAWKRRAGQPVPDHWTLVRQKLASPPEDDLVGGYSAHQRCADTYGEFAYDHPSFLFAYSHFAGRDIDPAIMGRSLELVRERWNFGSAWGWDFPAAAMCAARLGRRNDAVDFLLMQADKNTYRPNGHNAQIPRPDLPLYLPGNGALLFAVAMMAGGWVGSEGPTPGFPVDGNWKVACENFVKLPF